MIPFLYAASCREKDGGKLPFSELSHGKAGLLDDYELILGLEGARSVSVALMAVSQRKRIANKIDCPCACGRRLGNCEFRWKLATLRSEANRDFFRALAWQFKALA